MDHSPSIACTDGREVALKLDKWKKWDPGGTIQEVADVGDDGSGTKENTTNISEMISPQNYDQVSSVLSKISSVLDQNIMCNLLE